MYSCIRLYNKDKAPITHVKICNCMFPASQICIRRLTYMVMGLFRTVTFIHHGIIVINACSTRISLSMIIFSDKSKHITNYHAGVISVFS